MLILRGHPDPPEWHIEIFFLWNRHILNGILSFHSSDNPDMEKKRLQLRISLAVPLVSFGGPGPGILLQEAGLIADRADFSWGSVAGAIILAYLASLKPRMDIVSLCAPGLCPPNLHRATGNEALASPPGTLCHQYRHPAGKAPSPFQIPENRYQRGRFHGKIPV